MECIAFDAHKKYTLASVVTPEGQIEREEWIEHACEALRLSRAVRAGIAGGGRNDRQLVRWRAVCPNSCMLARRS